MLREIVMPKLGESMEEGVLLEWRVSEGDNVSKGDIIMEVETDKAVIEVESLVEGVLRQIVVAAGETAPIGETLAYVGDPGDPLPTESGKQSGAGESPKTDLPAPTAPAAAPPVRRRGVPPISPRARKLAEKLGIDITSVQGSGPGGRVVAEDIEALRNRAQQAPASPESQRVVAHTFLRRKTAERMLKSWTTIPCYDLTTEAGVDALVELRSRLNASADCKTAVHDLLIRAVALALNEFEILTGTWAAEGVQIPANYGIGLAVATPHGLVAPVVRNVRDLGLAEIARRSAALIDKAKNARLEPDDLTGACATISNLGMFGIDHFRPIVIPGQGSILGVGRIRHVAAVADGEILPSRAMSLTLAVDHRLADGDYAARFLSAIKDLLERPQRLSD